MQPHQVTRITFMTFAEKLKILVGMKGLSGRKLAVILGDISSTKANEWLKGKYVPDLPELVRLADYFGVSLDYLARDEVTEPRGDGLSEDERAILNLYRALQITQIDALRRLMGQPSTFAVPNSTSYAEEQATEKMEGKGAVKKRRKKKSS